MQVRLPLLRNPTLGRNERDGMSMLLKDSHHRESPPSGAARRMVIEKQHPGVPDR